MLVFILTLIFFRPFISSLAFPYLNTYYSVALIAALIAWHIIYKLFFTKLPSLKIPLALFVISITLSTYFSVNPANSIKEIYKYLTGILLFFFAASLNEEQKYRTVRIMVLSGFLISLLSIYQYLFGFKHLLGYLAKENISDPFILDYASQKRAFLPFVTPNILADYLLLIIPLTLIIKNTKKWIIFIILALAIFLTKSVNASIGLFAGVILYLYLRKDLPNKKYYLITLPILIFAAIFVLRQSATKEHLLPLFSAVKRLEYWQETLTIIMRYPILGVGLGNFNLTLSRYAHNTYLQICAELGIAGFLIISYLMISVFRTQKEKNKFYIPLIIANILFLLSNFLGFSFFLPEVALIWWVIIGLAI